MADALAPPRLEWQRLGGGGAGGEWEIGTGARGAGKKWRLRRISTKPT
jgi:hypothetical protein